MHWFQLEKQYTVVGSTSTYTEDQEQETNFQEQTPHRSRLHYHVWNSCFHYGFVPADDLPGLTLRTMCSCQDDLPGLTLQTMCSCQDCEMKSHLMLNIYAYHSQATSLYVMHLTVSNISKKIMSTFTCYLFMIFK